MRPDLLLIHPGDRAASYQSLGAELAAIEPPLWAGLLAAHARGRGYAVELLDANAEGLSAVEAATRTVDARPRLVAMVVYGHNPSASTQTMPAAGAICRAIKAAAPDVPILMAGGHVAALPARTLAEEAVDFVATGEGFTTICDLIEVLRSRGRLDAVRGLMYREDTRLRTTASAPLLQPLDSAVPALPWDLFPMDRYRAHNWHCFGEPSRQPYAALYTTLGCPYHCSYCCIQAPFRTGERALGLPVTTNSYRYWSPAAVVDQIDILVERYGVRHLKIADEMFVLNPRHVRDICGRLTERRHGLNMWAYARPDTVAGDLPDLLKAAGVNWLALGIESGAPHVRDRAGKPMAQRQIVGTVARLREAGIAVIANYVFGLPDDTIQTMQETLDLALELDCEFANFYCAMAYPGAHLHGEALAAGWRLPATWAGFSQHAIDTQPLPTRHVEARDVLRFRDAAFDTYFRRRSYLENVASRFGAGTAAEIERMTAHSLRRTLLEA